MATITRFLEDVHNTNKYIQTRNEISQSDIIRQYCAARCIQRHFRGYVTRQYLNYLHKSATNIQKIWRGRIGRKNFRHILQVHKQENEQKLYNYKATIIQKTWRGHFTRKQNFDYYHYKEYMKKMGEINRKIIKELNEYHEYVEQAEKERCKLELAKKKEKLLQKLHPMLRTETKPGVFSVLNSSEFSELEKLISSIKIQRTKMKVPDLKEREIPKIGKILQGPFLPYEEILRIKNDQL